MILRIWHLSDAREVDRIGSPYLHAEVEDWISTQIDGIPEEEWEAPDLAATDAAGVTIFVAAFGLERIVLVDVCGMGRLAEYPGELVFAGTAQKMIYVSQPEHAVQFETEEIVDPDTGQRTLRPIMTNAPLVAAWETPRTELRLRGLVVDKTRGEEILRYVESRATVSKAGNIDLML